MDRLRSARHRTACLTPVTSSPDIEVECDDCGLDPMCVVLDYAEVGSGLPEGILTRRRPVKRGEALFHMGNDFHSIFAIKSGSFKTLVPNRKGNDKVVGFHLAGELLGAEVLSGQAYSHTARALENSSVCEVRLERLPESGRSLESLQRSMIQMLGREVSFNRQLIASLVHQSAEQRVAGFLLSISQRLEHRGMPHIDFNLPMSRSNIGSYLGLASETVSRVLTRFSRAGLIKLQHKRVHLVDAPALLQIVNS